MEIIVAATLVMLSASSLGEILPLYLCNMWIHKGEYHSCYYKLRRYEGFIAMSCSYPYQPIANAEKLQVKNYMDKCTAECDIDSRKLTVYRYSIAYQPLAPECAYFSTNYTDQALKTTTATENTSLPSMQQLSSEALLDRTKRSSNESTGLYYYLSRALTTVMTFLATTNDTRSSPFPSDPFDVFKICTGRDKEIHINESKYCSIDILGYVNNCDYIIKVIRNIRGEGLGDVYVKVVYENDIDLCRVGNNKTTCIQCEHLSKKQTKIDTNFSGMESLAMATIKRAKRIELGKKERLKRSPPPLLCQSSKLLTLLRLPELPQCDSSDSTIKCNITIFKKNVKEYSVPATSMIHQVQNCSSVNYFFGAYVSDISTGRAQKPVETAKQCLKQNRCSFDGIMSNAIGSSINPVTCISQWFGPHFSSSQSCFFEEGFVTATHGGYMFSNLGPVSHCNYSQGFCITSNNIHITWTPNPDVKEEYIEAGKFAATRVETHVIVEELGESFIISNCTNVTCHTTEGFLIRFDNQEKIGLEGYKKGKDKAKSIMALIPNLLDSLSNSFQGSLDDKPTLDSLAAKLTALEDEMTSKIQYLADEVTGPISAIQSLCPALLMELRTTRSMAAINPTAYARTRLAREDIFAQVAGDFIAIWPCKPVLDYDFTKTQTCYTKVPIRYRMEAGGEWEKGFLDPKTNTISPSSPKTECGKSSVTLFETANKLYLYNPGTPPKTVDRNKATRLPPLTSNSSFFINIPDKWLYNKSDFDHVNTGDAAMEYISALTDPDGDYQKAQGAHSRESNRGASFGYGPGALGIITFLASLVHHAVLIFVVCYLCGCCKGKKCGNLCSCTCNLSRKSSRVPSDIEMDELKRVQERPLIARRVRNPPPYEHHDI
ncbi:putative glycoprotein [Beihai rhabdo-like virus 3]|uniref:Putative glycoprotein n=1 Tax=Beihai rhabdo-like virus 3 TaxID=1922653 RepID=A0A1L3KMU0_9MONO|nr:putative glycoprotein [Beihai rhabdo-like virus 3]APG78649.1 putative glycoprotein [Beihai rhabdo-like virus 3]